MIYTKNQYKNLSYEYCGNEATHQFKNGKWCCQNHQSKCPGMKLVNSDSLKGRKIEKFRKLYTINPDILCENGCGLVAKFISKNGKLYCNYYHNKCLVNRKINSKNQMGKLQPKGKDNKLYGRKRPNHSLFMKNNNPMNNNNDIKVKHKESCRCKEYKDNMSEIVKQRWLSKEYRKRYSESLIEKGLKRTDEEIGKQNAYYRNVLTITHNTLKNININPNNLPIGIGEGFYNIDHIFSIAEGFKRNINPKMIGSKFNLQLLPSKINNKKNDKCWITQKELEEKYNNENHI